MSGLRGVAFGARLGGLRLAGSTLIAERSCAVDDSQLWSLADSRDQTEAVGTEEFFEDAA